MISGGVRRSRQLAKGIVGTGVVVVVMLFATTARPNPQEIATFAGFRHHFFRGLPNRGFPAKYDARKIGRGEAEYPGREKGRRTPDRNSPIDHLFGGLIHD